MSAAEVVNTIGGLCELAGIGTVAWGIAETRREFTKRPGIVDSVKAAVARLRKRQDAVERPGTIRSQAGVHSATTGVVGKSWEQMTPDERLADLNRRLGEVSGHISGLRQDLTRESAERKQQQRDEAGAREQADRAHREQLGNLAGAGLRLETIGVSLFSLGVLLTTWPEWIASLLT